MGGHDNLAQYKYKIEDRDAFIKLANDKGIKFTDPVKHEYTYFKLPNETGNFSVLRIKVSDSNKSIDMKIRNEDTSQWRHFESKIDKPEELKNILENIGCEAIVTFHKNRTSYAEDEYRMDLDDLLEIGLYLEFKFSLSKKEEMIVLLKSIGLEEKNKDTRSIVEIYLDNNK